MAHVIVKEFSKKATSLLTGKTAKRIGKYKIPQFGKTPVPDKSKKETYSPEEIQEAVQEAADYFGGDDFIRFLNWSVIVYAQRKSNNDLRSGAAGLNEADKAKVTLLMNMAKREAEAEVGDYDEKGELVIDRKSKAYLEALKETLMRNLNKPKYAHLKSAFDVVEGETTIPFDLTPAGSMSSDDFKATDNDEEKESEESEESATA